ncbi:MAG: SdpI family protein [Ruminococcus sp.]|jgi:uncharacterized membrane protein|nr:SdpI family protein [Ruminococcus sp.]
MKKSIGFCTMLFVLEMIIGTCTLPTLPTQIPLHWDSHGNVDNWGEPWTIFLCPLISVVVMVITYVSSRFMEKNSEKINAIALVVSKLFFTVIFTWIILHAKEGTDDIFQIDRVIFMICGVMLIFMGMFLSKVEQNPVIGVRTPWTLKSTLVWKKTNLLGGILFVIIGIGFIICQLVVPSYMNMWLPLGLLILCIPILLIYSRNLYKSEKIHKK